MKKIFLFLLVFSIFFLVFPQNNALAAAVVCNSLNASPKDVNTSSTSTPDVVVTAQVQVFPGFDPNNFELYVNLRYAATGHFWVKPLTASPNKTPGTYTDGEVVTLTGVISGSQYRNSDGTEYDIVIQEDSTDTHLKNAGGQECATSFKIVLNQNDNSAGSCGSKGLDTNHYDCYYNGRWTMTSQTCDPGYQPDKFCFEGYENIGLYPPEYAGGFCGPCVPQTTPKNLAHGEICSDPHDCAPQLECRGSASGGTRCLYPQNTQEYGEACRVGQGECKVISTIGANLDCTGSSTNVNSPGNCTAIDQECNENLNQLCPQGQQCVNFHCEQIPITPNTSPVITPVGGVPYCDDWATEHCIYGCTPSVGGGTCNTSPGGPVSGKSVPGKIQPCTINGKNGIKTDLGCIPSDPAELFKVILTIAIGMAGGIAFLLILLGGSRILTSSGNPEAMNEGREIVSSALTGLLLIIFSVFILRFIGVDILRIPGFS